MKYTARTRSYYNSISKTFCSKGEYVRYESQSLRERDLVIGFYLWYKNIMGFGPKLLKWK